MGVTGKIDQPVPYSHLRFFRVTTVEGERERMIAVFSYYEKPGVMFSAEERVGFYGRAA